MFQIQISSREVFSKTFKNDNRGRIDLPAFLWNKTSVTETKAYRKCQHPRAEHSILIKSCLQSWSLAKLGNGFQKSHYFLIRTVHCVLKIMEYIISTVSPICSFLSSAQNNASCVFFRFDLLNIQNFRGCLYYGNYIMGNIPSSSVISLVLLDMLPQFGCLSLLGFGVYFYGSSGFECFH